VILGRRTLSAFDVKDEISAFSQRIADETVILVDCYLRSQLRFLGLMEWRRYLWPPKSVHFRMDQLAFAL